MITILLMTAGVLYLTLQQVLVLTGDAEHVAGLVILPPHILLIFDSLELKLE